jgi:hypothetical protein
LVDSEIPVENKIVVKLGSHTVHQFDKNKKPNNEQIVGKPNLDVTTYKRGTTYNHFLMNENPNQT